MCSMLPCLNWRAKRHQMAGVWTMDTAEFGDDLIFYGLKVPVVVRVVGRVSTARSRQLGHATMMR